MPHLVTEKGKKKRKKHCHANTPLQAKHDQLVTKNKKQLHKNKNHDISTVTKKS